MSVLYLVKAELAGVSTPSVWRRVVVDERATLRCFGTQLIQAMGWTGKKKFWFVASSEVYKDPEDYDPYGDFGSKSCLDSKRIYQIFKKTTEVQFVYDEQDEWTHIVKFEKKLIPGQPMPRWTESGTCPPEDIGGAVGYERFKYQLEIDPDGDESTRLLSWLGIKHASLFDADNPYVIHRHK